MALADKLRARSRGVIRMKNESKLKRYLIPAVLIAVGIGCVIWGVFDGEAGQVLKKAAAICMECIGLG